MQLRELRDALNALTDEQLEIDASVFLDGECYSVVECRLLSEMPERIANELADVFDTDQPLIVCTELDD